MIHIITDSMSDITQVQSHEMNITVVPLTVNMGEEVFVDGVTLDTQEFYAKMRKADKLPKTSQVTPDAFRRAFKKALEKDGDRVLCITGASALSGTYQSAVIAKDAQEDEKQSRIHLVDTMTACMGSSLLVRTAVKWRDEGMGLAEMLQGLEQLKQRVCISATVADLKYLVMGGRLSAVGAKVGGLLRLNPMIRVLHGVVKSAGVCRGKGKALDWLANELAQNPPDENYPIILGHADAMQSAIKLKDIFAHKGFLAHAPIIMEIGSVIGSHTGPGAYGMGWVKKAD